MRPHIHPKHPAGAGEYRSSYSCCAKLTCLILHLEDINLRAPDRPTLLFPSCDVVRCLLRNQPVAYVLSSTCQTKMYISTLPVTAEPWLYLLGEVADPKSMKAPASISWSLLVWISRSRYLGTGGLGGRRCVDGMRSSCLVVFIAISGSIVLSILLLLALAV